MRRGAKERQPKDRVKMINGNLIRNWREVKLYIISASGERTLSEVNWRCEGQSGDGGSFQGRQLGTK